MQNPTMPPPWLGAPGDKGLRADAENKLLSAFPPQTIILSGLWTVTRITLPPDRCCKCGQPAASTPRVTWLSWAWRARYWMLALAVVGNGSCCVLGGILFLFLYALLLASSCRWVRVHYALCPRHARRQANLATVRMAGAGLAVALITWGMLDAMDFLSRDGFPYSPDGSFLLAFLVMLSIAFVPRPFRLKHLHGTAFRLRGLHQSISPS